MNIVDKYSDNIVFMSIKKNMINKYLLFNGKCIRVYISESQLLDDVYDSDFIRDNPANFEVVGEIVIIYDEHLFTSKFDINNYDESEFVKKNHPMYIPNVNNDYFETLTEKIYVYHYPWNSITILNKNNKLFIGLVSNISDAIRHLTFGIKKIISYSNLNQGLFPIHASAICYKSNGVAFISGSHSGKTLLYANLISYENIYPLNDDIIFAQRIDDINYISGCPTKMQIRKSAYKTVNFVDDYCYNSKELILDAVPLKIVFIPEYGYERTKILKVDPKIYQKKIIRACTAHVNPNVDEKYLDFINSIFKSNIYKLDMSKDYNEVCKTVIDFLDGYSQKGV